MPWKLVFVARSQKLSSRSVHGFLLFIQFMWFCHHPGWTVSNNAYPRFSGLLRWVSRADISRNYQAWFCDRVEIVSVNCHLCATTICQHHRCHRCLTDVEYNQSIYGVSGGFSQENLGRLTPSEESGVRRRGRLCLQFSQLGRIQEFSKLCRVGGGWLGNICPQWGLGAKLW